jgi:hypothetical protein
MIEDYTFAELYTRARWEEYFECISFEMGSEACNVGDFIEVV